MPQPQEQQTAKERVFDENGVTTFEGAPGTAPEENAEPEEVVAEAPEAAEVESPVKTTAAKYRIGDREFTSQAEALAYAEDTARGAAAQQQLMQTLQAQPQPQQQTVTPASDQVPEEFFTNPQGYLKKFGQQVYEQTMGEVQRRQQSAQQSESIWREFTDRHPELADFRGDVESFTQINLATVQGIISTKGRSAGLDYIATKLKSDWARKADMLKPRRELSNTPAQRTPSQRSADVTPEKSTKKPLTFAEQINNIRKRGRRA